MRITPEGSYRNASRLNPVPVPHVPVGKSEVRPWRAPGARVSFGPLT